jgi:RNA polymerase alpha subunit
VTLSDSIMVGELRELIRDLPAKTPLLLSLRLESVGVIVDDETLSTVSVPDFIAERDRKSLDEVEMSPKLYSLLRNENIRTIGQLRSSTARDLLCHRGVGKVSVAEVQFILKQHGVEWGTEFAFPSFESTQVFALYHAPFTK